MPSSFASACSVSSSVGVDAVRPREARFAGASHGPVSASQRAISPRGARTAGIRRTSPRPARVDAPSSTAPIATA